MNSIDAEKYLSLYSKEYAPESGLNVRQKGGIAALLAFLAADGKVQDLRWAAYMLATVKHECAGTWQPIEENDKGKGRPYGKADPKTGKTYYGRGYVQLTWKDNYDQMGRVIGINLVSLPQLALDQATAYAIMSVGMRQGMFTGVGLSRYIHGDTCDYVNARRIINGTDCAEKVAGYAATIERLLKEAQHDA